MHRIAAETLIAVTSTAVMAAMVLFLGSVSAQPLTPGVSGPLTAPTCLDAPFTQVSESGVEGTAGLCSDSDGVRAALWVHGLREGEAYTAWLAYFDRPSACSHGPCGFIDLRGDDPPGVLGRIDGAFAPSSGELELRAAFRDLRLTSDAQVTLLVLSHGAGNEADGRTRARQLLTPQMLELGAPMGNALADRGRGWLHAQAIFTIER
jgi:hypothetical protein